MLSPGPVLKHAQDALSQAHAVAPGVSPSRLVSQPGAGTATSVLMPREVDSVWSPSCPVICPLGKPALSLLCQAAEPTLLMDSDISARKGPLKSCEKHRFLGSTQDP